MSVDLTKFYGHRGNAQKLLAHYFRTRDPKAHARFLTKLNAIAPTSSNWEIRFKNLRTEARTHRNTLLRSEMRQLLKTHVGLTDAQREPLLDKLMAADCADPMYIYILKGIRNAITNHTLGGNLTTDPQTLLEDTLLHR